MIATELKVKVTFTEKLLGSASGNKELHREYIASKSPNPMTIEDEVAALGADEVEKKDMTIFPRTPDGRPALYDYQIKGFFKNACGILRCVDGTESSKIKAYKKFIDGLVFVKPRMIPLQFDGELGNLQRPIRATTPQGERIALANSETAPAGTAIEFTVKLKKADLLDALKEWMDYGEDNGIGQWHNAGFGTFQWEEIK